MSIETSKQSFKTEGQNMTLDISKIQADFPILREKINGNRLVYLDNAASSQKPAAVIDAVSNYYRTFNSNIHRGLHSLAELATNAYEQTRTHAGAFIGNKQSEEIIFTRGATESLNLLAFTLGEQIVSEGDEILITDMEHHANFIPWHQLALRKKAVLKFIPITDDGYLELDKVNELLTNKTKIVSLVHMSNVLGTINPIAEIAEMAHKVGALVIVDGAQAVPHLKVDVNELGVDFYTLSSHKMLGPTGVGILWGKKEILDSMEPFNLGGEMIREVSKEKVTWNETPHKFEAGTPNIAGVVAFDAALTYLEAIGMDAIRKHEIDLTDYALDRLAILDGLEIQGPRDCSLRGGAVSFTDPNLHPHDISTFLDTKGIAIRAGHHCAQPLMRRLNKIATARASFYIYNDEADVDALVDAIKDMRKYFGV